MPVVSGGVLNGKALKSSKAGISGRGPGGERDRAVSVKVTVDRNRPGCLSDRVTGHPLLKAEQATEARGSHQVRTRDDQRCAVNDDRSYNL